jgi:hypothetical protein
MALGHVAAKFLVIDYLWQSGTPESDYSDTRSMACEGLIRAAITELAELRPGPTEFIKQTWLGDDSVAVLLTNDTPASKLLPLEHERISEKPDLRDILESLAPFFRDKLPENRPVDRAESLENRSDEINTLITQTDAKLAVAAREMGQAFRNLFRALEEFPAGEWTTEELCSLCERLNRLCTKYGLRMRCYDLDEPVYLSYEERRGFITTTVAGNKRKAFWTFPELWVAPAGDADIPGAHEPTSLPAPRLPSTRRIVLTLEEMQEELKARAEKSFGSVEANKAEIRLIKGYLKASNLLISYNGDLVNLRLSTPPRSKSGSFQLVTTGTTRETVYSGPTFPPLTAARGPEVPPASARRRTKEK